MPFRSDLVACCALAVGLSSCLGRSSVETRALEVGHHRLQLVVPEDWEHLDHGRQQLFRSGYCQISLVDMGVATNEGLVSDLREAEALWHDGRRADALARVREIRGPMFQGNPPGRVADFWKPWTDATDHPDLADSVAIGAAFSVLIDSTAMFPPVTDERLLEYVLDSSMDTRRREIARRSERTIHGSDWIEVETWDRVSHLFRSRLAWIESGGYLLVLSIDHGPFEEAAVAFEALLTSIQVTPAAPGPQ